jgi:hypothetical protein
MKAKIELTAETKVVAIRFKTKSGLGLGKFYTEDGLLILDEAKGNRAKYDGNYATGTAEDFGSLRVVMYGSGASTTKSKNPISLKSEKPVF